MSNSYTISFDASHFPTNSEIESYARFIESSFRLDPSFDFLESEGFCPYKYKRKKQGFEWSYTLCANPEMNA